MINFFIGLGISIFLVLWSLFGLVAFSICATGRDCKRWKFYILLILGGPVVWLCSIIIFIFVILGSFSIWLIETIKKMG